MRKTKIVAVNRFYSPDTAATAQLLSDLAEHLVSAGYEVVIVTSRLQYAGSGTLPKTEMLNGVEVRRIWSSGFGRSNLIGRSLDYITFFLFAFVEMLRVVRYGDTIIAKTDPPMIALPATLVARLKGARLVNWCQDLFPEIATALGIKWVDGVVGEILRSARNWTLRSAAFNAALHEKMSERLQREGVPKAKIRVLPNWADTAIVPIPHEQNPIRKEWGLEGFFVVGYSGNLGRAHLAHAVADLVAATKDVSGIRWLFIGGGSGIDLVKAAAKESSNVIFKPYQARERLSYSLSAPDIHLVSLDPSCEGLIVPSKFYGAIAAGRPVAFMGSPEGAIAHEIKEIGDGVVLSAHETTGEHLALLLAARSHQLSSGYAGNANAAAGLDKWLQALSELER